MAGVSLVLGGMIVQRVVDRWSARTLITTAMLTMATLVAVLAVRHSFPWMIGLTFLLFVPVPTVAVAGQPYLLGLIPDELRGRVLTAAVLASLVISVGAQALTGLVLGSQGFAALAWGVVVLLLLAAVVGAFSTAVRAIRTPGAQNCR